MQNVLLEGDCVRGTLLGECFMITRSDDYETGVRAQRSELVNLSKGHPTLKLGCQQTIA